MFNGRFKRVKAWKVMRGDVVVVPMDYDYPLEGELVRVLGVIVNLQKYVQLKFYPLGRPYDWHSIGISSKQLISKGEGYEG